MRADQPVGFGRVTCIHYIPLVYDIITASGVGIIGNGVLSTRSLFQKHGKRLLVAVTLIHQEHQAGRI